MIKILNTAQFNTIQLDSILFVGEILVTELGFGTESISLSAILGILTDVGVGSDMLFEIALVLPPIFDSGISVDSITSILAELNITELGTGLENISLVQFINVLKILAYMKQNLNINTNQKDTLNLNTNMPVY